MGGRTSSLKPQTLNELLIQTNFTCKEVQDWYSQFKKDCPGGSLTEDRFKGVYREFFPTGDADQFAKHAFRSFDTNKDNMIDFREFVCALNVMSKGSTEQKLKWAFAVYDVDGDGYIVRTEMEQIITAVQKLIGTQPQSPEDPNSPQTLTANVFTKMDSNNDDKLSVEEFMEGTKADPSLVRLLQCQ